MQQFLSSLIPLLVILPLLGGCLACRKASRSTTRLMLLLVAITHLFITITLVISLISLPINEPDIRWSIPLNFTRWSPGLFEQVALRFDFVSGVILLMLPLILWTSFYNRTSSVGQSPVSSFFLLGGASLLVIANDVASLMGGSMFAALLRDLASQMNLKRYKKHKRGPKKKPLPKTEYKQGAHVSTARLIAERPSR